jgi:cytochrome c5
MKILQTKNLLIASAILLSACTASKITEPTITKSKNKVVDATAFADGKKLYETKCNTCHKLYSPASRNEEKWTKVLDWMQPKAKVTDLEKQTIYLYLTSHE